MYLNNLKEESQRVVEKLISDRNFEHDDWIRFWDEKSIQLDGDFNLSDLKFFVEIMSLFAE
jgi:hypothetical protein